MALAAAGRSAAALVPGAYAAALLGAPIANARARGDPRGAILLPAVLATMHLAWAAGFVLSPLKKAGEAGPLRLLRQAARIGPCRSKNPDRTVPGAGAARR